MTELKQNACATLIGDVIRSRSSADRQAVHERLSDALAAAADAPEPYTPLSALRITVGDEYQGTFASIGAAVRAALRVRLAVLPLADVRHGVGWGPVEVLQGSPRVEDGPGWWAARDAIERAEAGAEVAGTRRARTWFVTAPGEDAGVPTEVVNAALLCRDELIDPDDERSLRLLRGHLAGRTQVDLASDEGISPSAVSQRIRHKGIAVVAAADRMLGELR